MTTELTKAAQRLDDFFVAVRRERARAILRYALDHVVPRLKPRASPSAPQRRPSGRPTTVRAFSLATMGAEFVRCKRTANRQF